MPNSTLEQVKNTILALPHEDRKHLQEWLDAQACEDARQAADTMPAVESFVSAPTFAEREARFQRALRWLEENKAQYVGLWVALDGDRLVASGVDGKQVHTEAVAAGVAVPLLQQIHADDDLPFGGW